MEDLLRDGWSVKGPRSYFHYSGPKVFLRGNTWTARKVTGELSNGHASAEAAIRWLVAHDSDYWTLGDRLSCGLPLSGILTETGFLDPGELKDVNTRDHVVVLYLRKGRRFPRQAEANFNRLFLSRARCAKCGSQANSVVLRSLPNLRSMNRRAPYIVCGCGHPVWRISLEAYDDAEDRLTKWEEQRNKYEWRRKRLKSSGGKHRASDIEEILRLQNHRCIYCNRPFGDALMSTRDHLTPVCMGGTDWALNIVMSCQGCNSRRGMIPFRTYCRLLSPMQNRRIVRSLVLRISELSRLPVKQFDCFCEGLSRQDSRGWRYRAILRSSATARRNADCERTPTGHPFPSN